MTVLTSILVIYATIANILVFSEILKWIGMQTKNVRIPIAHSFVYNKYSLLIFIRCQNSVCIHVCWFVYLSEYLCVYCVYLSIFVLMYVNYWEENLMMNLFFVNLLGQLFQIHNKKSNGWENSYCEDDNFSFSVLKHCFVPGSLICSSVQLVMVKEQLYSRDYI